MTSLVARAWGGVLRPMIRRPNRLQVAALCYRTRNGRTEVLLVTTRGTGRWMLPKGWPMDGKTGPEAARIEAWEEAGVCARRVGRRPLGAFDYRKHHDYGLVETCSANVYPIQVDKVVDAFPEAGQRQRRWVGIEETAELVDEAGLRALLRAF